LSFSRKILTKRDAAATQYLAGLSARSTSDESASFKLGRRERAQGRTPVARDGNSQILSSNPLMNNRLREAYLNVPMVKRATNLFRDFIVGQGIQTFLDPFDWSFGFDLRRRDDDEFLHSLNVSLEMDEKFKRWGENPKFCDVSGKKCLVEIQRLAISEEVLTGDSIILKGKPADSNSPVPWALMVIEREQLDIHRDRSFSSSDQFSFDTAVINGFVIDRLGRELGCYIHDVHPEGYFRSSGHSEFIPANNYYHIFSSYRPSQHFGATWLHGLGQLAIDRDLLTDAELKKARKQALIAFIHKSSTPDLPVFGMDDLENFAEDVIDSASEIRMGENTIAQTIGVDEEIELVESASPNNGADRFFEMIDHDAAAAVDLSFYSMTGQFGKTNYTGFRGASNLENAQMLPLQYLFSQAFMLPMRQEWNRDAVAYGHITQLSPKDFAADEERWQRIDCIGTGRYLIEPDKETEAALTQMRSGLSHLKYECARQGKDFKNVLRSMAVVNRAANLVGVILDYGKGNGGENTSTTTEKTNQESND